LPRLEDLDPESREFIENYHCRVDGPPAATPLTKPLSEARVALITSSGLIQKGTEPFDLGNPGGDPTYRIIRSDIDPADLTLSIVSANWDRSAFAADVNAIFPMDRVRELADEGIIGSLADDYYAFMGSIFDIEPVATHSAPAVGELLRQAEVDVALLVPV
jgi:D-proline reductase (dithiol) PrdB